MLKQITFKNTFGEEKTFFLHTEDIAFIKEKHQEPTRLYDEDGNLVSETQPTEKVFELVLVLKNNYHLALNISEQTALELSK